VLTQHRVALLQRHEIQALDRVVDEKNRVTRIERVLEATKAHRLLALGVPAKDVRHARGAE